MAEREDENVQGMRGESAGSMAGGMHYYAQPEADTGFWLKDRVRWGPVWAGVVVALATQLLLSALGIAIGLSRPAAVADAPQTISSALGIWVAVSTLIALFLGGLFAARLAGIAGRWNGVWNGVVVWALALTLSMVALGLGLSGLLGMASNFAGTGAVPSAPTAVSPEQAARATSIGALWFLIWGIVSLLAAAIGGAVGARHSAEVTSEHGQVAPAA